MNETEYLKGRLEALSLIVATIFSEMPDKDTRFGPRLVCFARRYFEDTPLDAQSEEFRNGFHTEFDRMIATLDAPIADELSN